MFVTVSKQALVASTIVFDGRIDDENERIRAGLSSVFIDVVSLDAIDGNPVAPTTGTYSIYYQDATNSGFKRIPSGGRLDAIKTGGTALPDGTQEGATIFANALAIKVVPDGIDVAAAYRVHVKQNLN